MAAAPVRVQNRDAVLTVPLTLRQQEIEVQIDELDRRVLLGTVLFILLGAMIGYWMAERIADPVNRLMKATGRIARGDLDARILATSSDEFRRLVDVQSDGCRSAAPTRRARAHAPAGGMGRYGAAGRARYQKPAHADSTQCRAPAARASRSGNAARHRAG